VSDEESLSVVMPVYNALPHLDGAIRSILDQTHRNYEFVIYDDASTDGSTERLRQWARDDSRIRLFEGKRNLGPVGSSAFIVEHSTGPLVARMDADDLCAPDRLERQLEVLRNYPCAGLVGTLFDVINDRGQKIRGPDLWRLTRKAPFVPFAAHGSILFRRSVFDQVAGYRAECEYWEDQDLVTRMAAVTAVMVIPSALYQVRQWTKSTRATSDRERVENAVDLMYRAVGRLEQGRSYDDLLQARDQPARVDPRVFISAGSIVLWSGDRPLLFGRLLRRGRLRFDMRTLSAVVWTAWATLSPASLRAFMGLLLRVRNRRSRGIVADSAPMRWSPPVHETKR
jgi:glycosyltransferase involved in cell wall biosynthesis